MKVTGLKTYVVEGEKPWIGGRYFLFIEIHTDGGIYGLGERVVGSSYPTPETARTFIQGQQRLIEELFENYVLGENPLNIELIWDKMYASRHDFRHPSLYATPAMSAIDMALWDISGKVANLSLIHI